MPPPSRRLVWLEVLRGVAALLVVLFHVDGISFDHTGATPFGGWFVAGRNGVDLFFVLSGFIIVYVHRGDVGRPAALGRYAFNRFTRIYPSVWVMSAFAAVTYLAGFGGAAKAGKLAPARLAASVLLVAQHDWPLVNVTWTLVYEVFFYALFALAIWRRRVGVAALVAWQAAVLALALTGTTPIGGAWTLYLRPFCAEFGFGIACALLVRRAGPLRLSDAALRVVLAAGVAVFAAGLVVGAWLPHVTTAPVAVALYGLSAAAVILGVAGLELRDRLPRPPALLVAFGGASYAIYLVHYSVISLLVAALGRAHVVPSGVAIGLALAAVGVAAGFAFDRYVDQPIRRALRRLRERGSGWALWDLNPRPNDYESPALTAELRARHRRLPGRS